MQVWAKDGDLLAGNIAVPDRPGIRPLTTPPTHLPIPDDLGEWTELGQECTVRAAAQSAGPDGYVVTVVTLPTSAQQVQLTQHGVLLAENSLGRPVDICSIDILSADDIPGLEIVIIWQVEDEAQLLRGLSVFRIPETVQY